MLRKRIRELDIRHHRPTGMVLLLLNDLVGARKQGRQNEKGDPPARLR